MSTISHKYLLSTYYGSGQALSAAEAAVDKALPRQVQQPSMMSATWGEVPVLLKSTQAEVRQGHLKSMTSIVNGWEAQERRKEEKEHCENVQISENVAPSVWLKIQVDGPESRLGG